MTRMIKGLGLMLALCSLTAQAESKRYLVQFKSTQTFKSVMQNMRASQPSPFASISGMKLLGSGATVGEALQHLDMLIVEANDPTAISSLKNHPAIALVEEEIFHPAPKPMVTRGNQVDSARRARVTNMDTPWGILAVKAPEAWTTTKGETARVMVLDTGLDQAHKAVRSRFEQGRNFTTMDMTDITDEVGHGTHVAGTILGDGLGVAPQAKLLMGKVCSTRGCGSAAIAAGINWAIDEHVDVVNMSLAGMFMSNGEALALQRAEAEGVLVIAASGNEGTANVSYPAAYMTVLAVGAVDSHLLKADFSQWGPQLAIMGPGVDVISSVPQGTGREAQVKMALDDGQALQDVKSLPFVGSPVMNSVENEVVFAGLGKVEDFALINVVGKFALISRGEIPFTEKVTNAIQAGATGVIIYNNAPGLLQGILTDDGTEAVIPAVMIEQTVGENAKLSLDQGMNVRFSLSIEGTDYASLQGTSMATPHVAGVAALVRAANKSLTPAQVRDLLKATATPLGPNLNNEYGSGLVNAEAAVARALTETGPVFRVAN